MALGAGDGGRLLGVISHICQLDIPVPFITLYLSFFFSVNSNANILHKNAAKRRSCRKLSGVVQWNKVQSQFYLRCFDSPL